MHKNATRTLTAACAALSATLLLATSTTAARADQCQFFDAGTNESADGECTVEYSDSAETITVGVRTFVFKTTERQGQWAVGTLDGAPAMRYEINRTQYSYATRDLTRFLDLTVE